MKIAPEHSMPFVAGPEDNVLVPFCDPQEFSIWSTESCGVFAYLMYRDGDTEVTFAPASELNADSVLRSDCVLLFDGDLEVPERRRELTTAEAGVLLKAKAKSDLTWVRIWSDHPKKPEHVFIGID